MTQLGLAQRKQLFVHQVREVAELLGFETRNKYRIVDDEQRTLAYAAEQGKGFLGFIIRQYLGHWRKFDVHFFDESRNLLFVAHHPFRWIFECIEIRGPDGRYLGTIQKRWSIFTKRFDVQNERGQVIMEVASPLLKFWTFSFMNRSREVASVKKKWSGLFNEALTDKDVFLIEYPDPSLGEAERALVLVSSVFIDLLYFEHKAR